MERDKLGRFVKGVSGNPLTQFKKGYAPSNKGKKGHKMSKETRRKMSLNNQGEKNPAWSGGTSFEPYPVDWTDNLKESIKIRDNYTCQECGTHQDELDRKLPVHHIDYDKKNLNPDNLISLCNSCHTKTCFNRKYWIQHFLNIIRHAEAGGKK